MTQDKLVLVSHALCPYVQRAAIVLLEKGVAFERRDIDLADKPGWFLAISPLGKTPLLLVGQAVLFESSVICEYLDETHLPALHPADPLRKARQRAWMEFGSSVLQGIAGLYNAADEASLGQRAAVLRQHFAQVEAELQDGPWFAGAAFGLVDAVFGPVFRYLDAFEEVGAGEGAEAADLHLLAGLPKVQAWRAALRERPSVKQAVAADYPARLRAFLRARGSALSRRMALPGRAD